MKQYKKPKIASLGGVVGIVPAALGVQALSVGGAFVVGAASGLMKDNKYDNFNTPHLIKVTPKLA